MKKQNNIAGISLLVGVTIALQLLSSLFSVVLQFSLSLVMIPIVIAAVYYGMKGSMIVGTAFGATVFVQCVTGLDVGGAILLGVNPVFTLLATVVRGLLVGLIVAAVRTLMCKLTHRLWLSTGVTAAAAVISNTGLFVLLFSTLFNKTLHEWAGGEDAITYIVFSLVGINFVIEFATAVLLSPPICKALSYVKRKI